MAAMLIGCLPTPPANTTGLEAVTAVPTLDLTDPHSLCDAVSLYWGRDWEIVIRALEGVHELKTVCANNFDTSGRLYSAYIAYGTLLEQRGRISEAVSAYQSALIYNRIGAEATTRLNALNIAMPQPLQRCPAGEVMGQLTALADYTPTEGHFVEISGNTFTLNGQPYVIYGINYYPRDTPGKRFLTQTNVDFIGFELDLIRAAGINTLRLFLQHALLFTCPGNGAVPIAENFTRLDEFIHAAAARDYKLIIVLNDEPDLTNYPLYTNPTFVTEQLIYLLTRYRDEPAILAWDLRDSGDLNYLSQVAGENNFTREAVLDWLIHTAITARQTDPNHPVTASWLTDIEVTIPAVDFVSFQHYSDSESLRQRIASLKSQTQKPILLASIGYSTFAGLDENTQRDMLYQSFEAVQRNALAGWLVWTAFDYPLTVTCDEPDCLSEDSAEHHFGLWNTSYFPKLSIQAVKTITGAE